MLSFSGNCPSPFAIRYCPDQESLMTYEKIKSPNSEWKAEGDRRTGRELSVSTKVDVGDQKKGV